MSSMKSNVTWKKRRYSERQTETRLLRSRKPCVASIPSLNAFFDVRHPFPQLEERLASLRQNLTQSKQTLENEQAERMKIT
jgi:hypothetical protein